MYKSLRQECFEANLRLPALGLVIYTFGNVSCVDRRKGVCAIKPSGVEYGKLHWRDIVIVDLESGRTVDGSLRPSSETDTHLVLYREFPGVGGIVHTHSPYASAWAQALRDVPVYGTTHADLLPSDIPCTRPMPDELIRGDYETETGNAIVKCFRERTLNSGDVPMALVAGHGPFAWGKDAPEAVHNIRMLEELCKIALLTEQLNPDARRLSDALIARHYERKHGKNAYYGQN